MNRYCFALDLVDDPVLIAEYENWHIKENCWPEIKKSILDAGVAQMEIYRTGNRLFMIMDTYDWFNFDDKAVSDAANPDVQKWEELMWKYQLALPWAKEGEKWVRMKEIFELI
jgi:L-rhamnose mutarotase